MSKSAAQQVDAGKTMAEMWEGFAALVIPFAGPGTTQYEEMRKAFYSGALCLFNWMMVQLDPADEVTPGDLLRVDAMDAEINGFFVAMRGAAS